MDGQWTFNTHEEDLWNYESFDTKEEAIKAAQEYFNDEYQTVMYVGQIEMIPLPTDIDVDYLFERLDEQYNNSYFDETDYLFDGVSEEDRSWLENKLSDVMEEFYKKAHITSNYYTINNIETIMR